MRRATVVTGIAALIAVLVYFLPASPRAWTPADIELLQSLSLDSLGPLPVDPGNGVADEPRAAAFGHALFFDTRLSANDAISCAFCHQPERRFTDGLQKGQALGTSARNTPSIVGVAYSPWLYWDGRRDSLWSQALSPLQDVNEHGLDRRETVGVISSDPVYAALYRDLFGALPDAEDPAALNRAFANVGKLFAAYERKLKPGRARFDEYVAAVAAGDTARQAEIYSQDEILGLQLFIDKGNCLQCHNGPLLTNNEFHNTGVLSFPGELPDKGRAAGVRDLLAGEFTCNSPYNDDAQRACPELEFLRTGPELVGAFRTPSLRNLENTEPYMHKGQLATLAAVLEHYNDAPLAMIGHNEAKPLKFSRRELRQLEAFLHTLAAPPATEESWLRPPPRD